MTANKKPPGPWKIQSAILLTTLFLFRLSWLSISTLTFFSGDTGLRFIQIQALIEQNWQSFAIPYKARFVDPDLHHVPYYFVHLVIKDEIYFPITPFFPLLTSFLFYMLGWAK